MKLYEVTNGYMGQSCVRCLVISENQERALQIAEMRYKQRVKNTLGNKEDYWKRLVAEEICDDTQKEWSNEVNDG